jgi:hypothetical protein
LSMNEVSLTGLERELLQALGAQSAGETAATLHDVLAPSPGLAAIDATLRGLLARGLLATDRRTWFGGHQGTRVGRAIDRVFGQDWWTVTNAGRAAIGLPRETGLQAMQ